VTTTRIQILVDADAVTRKGAKLFAAESAAAVVARGRLTGIYMKRRRTLLIRSRRIVCLVTSADKHPMLPRLLAANAIMPAGHVRQKWYW
jgi:hypothetical protein